METKDAYRQRLKTQLKEWSAQIDLLAAKAENVGADVKIKYTRELDKLRAKLREATEKVKELEEASGDAWGEVKETADKVWDDLKTGVASVASKFK
ncbi:MAG TPA: hypothetical protein ACFYD6_10000 [Candidatus Brocadiia bacterium]|nr:hypothetical protein [Planctomycetota bacterium]MDO8092065.1 hypothetical protein [Candidatus Brocadiales bacterium]